VYRLSVASSKTALLTPGPFCSGIFDARVANAEVFEVV
jgi:hypothetical protein